MRPIPRDAGTLEKLLECSRQEFLENGFKNASLRNIAAAAGLTTGAIFGYFKNKNAIFEALVDPICEQVEKMFAALSESYYNADGAASAISMRKSIGELRRIYEFIYANFNDFRLLLCCAEGSSKADFVHTIVEYEVRHTFSYLDRLNETRALNIYIDRATIHILSDSYINSLLEPVRHNMSFEEAIKNIEFLGIFYTGGWKAVFKTLSGGE